MTTEEFLARLSHVKKAGPNQWKAQCPSHEDTSGDSLSITSPSRVSPLHVCTSAALAGPNAAR